MGHIVLNYERFQVDWHLKNLIFHLSLLLFYTIGLAIQKLTKYAAGYWYSWTSYEAWR